MKFQSQAEQNQIKYIRKNRFFYLNSNLFDGWCGFFFESVYKGFCFFSV